MPSAKDRATTTALLFDDFRLGLRPAGLEENGQAVPLQSQPLRLLTLLVSRHGEVVSRDEIAKFLWGDSPIDYSSRLHVCVRQIRKALRDDGAKRRYIESVPRRGYRFVADTVLPQTNHGLLKGNSNSQIVTALLALPLVMLVAGLGVFLHRSAGESVSAETGAIIVAEEDAYVEGSELIRSGKESDALLARSYFKAAMHADPEFAPSFAGMAKAYEIARDYDSARSYAQQAIDIDSTYAEAYLRLAAAESYGSWDWTAAESHIHKALEIAPESANVHYVLATNYAATGRLGQGLREMEKALSLDPASTALLTEYGLFLYYDGQTESARAHCQEALELEPRSIAAQRCLYKVELIDKNFDVALNHALVLMSSFGAEASDIDSVASLPPLQGIAEFENWSFHQLEQRSNTEAVSPLLFAFSSAVLRKYDDAFYFLIKGYNEHYASVPLAMWDPFFIPIRHQSRFVKLADDMGIKFPSDF